MTYEEAKLYIEKVSRTGSILGLESIENLMQELGNVQEQLPIIHIAGTNGKGSIGAFIESVLIEAGFRVGRYTSPAVFEAFEVWRINRENISQEKYLECLEEVKTACERMLAKALPQPTVFEVETALAFVYFYKEKCDYVLLEVGMGGETDATNLITKPLCSVLTSISMDHMQFLGNSLKEIAGVKAGIIKEGCPVVTIDTQKSEVMQVIKDTAEKKSAVLFIAEAGNVEVRNAETKNVKIKNTEDILKKNKSSEDEKSQVKWECRNEKENSKKENCGKEWNDVFGISYFHEEFGTVELEMFGIYQIENSILAATVCKKVLKLSNDMILQGLKKTYWPGRFEVISKKPFIILDGAHNEDAAQKLAQTIRKHFTNKKITYIIGVLADKEYKKILEIMLPLAYRVYTVTPSNKRALDGQVLAEEIRSMGKEAIFCKDMKEAGNLTISESNIGETDVIIAFGSLSYLAELKKEFRLPVL